MRHQVRRPSAPSDGPSSSAAAAGGAAATGDGGSAGGSSSASGTGTSSSSGAAGPSRVGPVTPHSVIRTLRQKSMVNSEEPKRSSFVDSSSTSTLIANLEAAHQREAEHLDNPCVIIKKIVGEMGNVIKEMRADSALENLDGTMAMLEGSDVDALKQRVVTLERANRMMAIHLDLLDLQKKLEAQAEQKLDERKSFLTATREELFKEIVELLEAEFSCSICNEVFVSPSVTPCGHTFCELCIATWNRDKNDCPICRTVINAKWGKHVEMDNFITRLHIRLSEEIRSSRESLVQERVQQLEQLRNAPPPPPRQRLEFQIPAVVDRIIIRDREGASGTNRLANASRAFAERLRAIRRQASESAQDDPDAPIRLRARVIHEIMRHRYEQRRQPPSTRPLETQPTTTGSGPTPARLTIPVSVPSSIFRDFSRARPTSTPTQSTTGVGSGSNLNSNNFPSPIMGAPAPVSTASSNGTASATTPASAPITRQDTSPSSPPPPQNLYSIDPVSGTICRVIEGGARSTNRSQGSTTTGTSSNNSSSTSAPVVPDVDIEMMNPYPEMLRYRVRASAARRTNGAGGTPSVLLSSSSRDPLSIPPPRRPHTRSQDSLGRTLLEMRDNELRSRIRRARASRTRLDRSRRESSSSERDTRGTRGPTITIRFREPRGTNTNTSEGFSRGTESSSSDVHVPIPGVSLSSSLHSIVTSARAMAQPSTSRAENQERPESPTVVMECDTDSPVPSASTAAVNVDTEESQSPPDVLDVLPLANLSPDGLISGDQQESADMNGEDDFILIED